MPIDYRIRSSAWDVAPGVVAFVGREALGQPYRFDVGVVWVGPAPAAPEQSVGEAVTLEIDRDGREPHRWHGVIEAMELVLSEGASSYWRLTFGPRLGRLSLSEHSRIFTAVSIPRILSEVLEDEGIGGEGVHLGLTEEYPPREHVCQFRESSLAFVQRLCEREGISFRFDHGEDAEVVSFFDDSRAAAGEALDVRYVPLAGDGAVTGEALVELRAKRTMGARGVRLGDYDPMRPRLSVVGEAKVPGGDVGEIVRWGDHVTSPEEAARYARVRAEELASSREVFRGSGVVVGLRAGRTFALRGHPALDDAYLVTSLVHRAAVGSPSAGVLSALGLQEVIGLSSQLRVEVEAVRAALRYRSPSVTPWPRIAGVVTGAVDGPASSQYAQLDAEGRYKVRLHFDEGDLADGSRSTWVRMLQPHGGNPEGIHFPLRKGTEVAVIFLGGDPDRPHILGVAPNPETPSPVLRDNFTQNVVQTGGGNRLVFEDVAGGQSITESTPTARSSLHLGAGAKNLELRTDGRGRLYTGGDLDVDVDVDRTEDVTGHVTETYRGTQDLTVGGAVVETLSTSLFSTIGGPVTHTFTGPLDETVDGPVEETFGDTLSTTVSGGLTALTYSGGLSVTVSGDVTERFSSSQSTTVDGPLTLIVGGSVHERHGSLTRHVKGTFHLGVAGTYKILTPTMVMQSPGWNVLSNIAKRFIAESFKVDKSSAKMELVKVSRGVVRNSITGISLSATGARVTLAGMSSSKGSNKNKTNGFEAWAVGVYIYTGALLLLNGGAEVE